MGWNDTNFSIPIAAKRHVVYIFKSTSVKYDLGFCLNTCINVTIRNHFAASHFLITSISGFIMYVIYNTGVISTCSASMIPVNALVFPMSTVYVKKFRHFFFDENYNSQGIMYRSTRRRVIIKRSVWICRLFPVMQCNWSGWLNTEKVQTIGLHILWQ